MLTDDDLTRQLSSAFRESTDDVRYAGRVPAPRTAATTIGVPLASTAAVAAALAVVWASSPDTEPVPPPSADGSRASVAPTTTTPDTTGQSPELVTDTIEVAGYTFAYRHAADEPVVDVLHVFAPERVPASARPVDVPAPAKAWVGTDPGSGEAAIYLQDPSRYDGRLFGISVPGLDEDQMVTFLHS